MLEASSIEFSGNVVVPELPFISVATTPANIVLLHLRKAHIRDRVHYLAPEVVPDSILHDPEPAPSDRSSEVPHLYAGSALSEIIDVATIMFFSFPAYL